MRTDDRSGLVDVGGDGSGALCFSDGELYFVPDKAGSYELGFVLDLEWVGFDNPLLDISGQAVLGTHLVGLPEPARVSPDELRRDPFFLAYESSAPVDFGALCRLVVYRQLSTWGMVAGEPAEPEKKAWIRDAKLPLINRLLDQVSQNANSA